MARKRWVGSTIEVALISTVAATPPDPITSTDPDGLDPGSARLIAALHEQGLEPSSVTPVADSDPARLRARLADVLAGPADLDPADAALPPLALLAADIVVSSTPLGAVLDDPRVGTGALAFRSGGSVPRPGSDDRSERQLHLGVLKVDGPDRALAAALVRDLPVDADPVDAASVPGDLLLDLTRALTAAGVEVRPVQLGGYAWGRPSTPDDVAKAVAAVEALDERNVRLREAARGGDGFYSTFALRRVSWRFTSVAERIRLTPNQVTVMSFVLGLIAAGFLALGSRPWSIVGALLLQFCLIVDCVDGELARYRRRFSRFGAWLDATTDRVKEFAAIGALAVAGARHEADLWWLVAAAIALQTFRNLLDLGWAMQRGVAAGAKPVTPAPPEWVASATWLRPPVTQHGDVGAASWLKRIGHFPIGERFLLISLGAALWSPRATLILLLVAGLLSAAYMILAFVVRSRSAIGPGYRIVGLVDAGPLLGSALRQAVGRRAGRAAAALPAMIAIDELVLIWGLAVVAAGAEPSAAVVLIAVTAIAHYQHAYGVREDADPELSGGFVVGTDLRLVALALITVIPSLLLSEADAQSWATSAVWALAVLVAISATVRSLQTWTGATGPKTPNRSADPDDPNRPAGPGPLTVSGEQTEQSVDRMETVNADTGPTVLRPTIGGVR